MEKDGVHFLENDSAEIILNGQTVTVTGLEIPMDCYARPARKELTAGEIQRRIGKVKKEKGYQILLAHNPLFMQRYMEWGADLVLSGHLHGGIVRIPWIGGVIAPSFQLFPKYSGGIYREGEQTVVVSRGLGTHTVNIRLFNPAEMVVLLLGNEQNL